MKRRSYFGIFRGAGWPSPSELKPYFLGAPGQPSPFDSDNDSWGLSAEGVDGTEHLPEGKGRIDVHLYMIGNPDLGVLLQYDKAGGGIKDSYCSSGDLRRLQEWVRTNHGDIMPVGLFIPRETAWKAVEEFIKRDGVLPQSIAWIAGRDLPKDAFPDPAEPDPRRG